MKILMLLVMALIAVMFCPSPRPSPVGRGRRWVSRQCLGLCSAVMLGIEEALYFPTRMWTRIKTQRLSGSAREIRCFANIAEGTHSGEITRLSDAAMSTRFVLIKQGTDGLHGDVCGAGDMPLGTFIGETLAAEERFSIFLLGLHDATLLMVANGAITTGTEVYTAASGKVSPLSGSAGTYYKVGRALTAAAVDGDLVEVLHCYPVAKVVS